MILLLKILLALPVLVCAQNNNYTRYRLYEFVVKTRDQINSLIPFFDMPCMKFWGHVEMNAKSLVFVTLGCERLFTKILNDSSIRYKIRRRTKEMVPQVRQKNEYPSADDIYVWMDELAVNFSEKVTLTTIGQSYENRNLTVIQVSSNPKAHKPVIFVNSAIHGRNWLGPVVTQKFIIDLLGIFSYLLDHIEWHFLPLANPDGYIYSQNHDNLWLKTRSHQGKSIGVDINRNFDCHWNGSQSNDDPSYGGPSAFSENETRSIADYLTTWKNRIKLYLSFGNYGNYIVFPWGYTTELPGNYEELRKLAEEFNDAMVRAGSKKYTIGTVSQVWQSVSGIDVDWVKAQAGVELSYIIELPRAESSEFNPQSSRMLAVSEQVSRGMAVFGEYVAKKFGK